VTVSARDLTDVSTTEGAISLAGLRINLRVSLEYLIAWIGGAGAVAIDNLMEDAATVEISRMQVWQWLRHRARLDDGTEVTPGLVEQLLTEEVQRLAGGSDGKAAGEVGRDRLAAAEDVVRASCLVAEPPPFFTSYAYRRYLVTAG
jgi:malate synthase